MRRICVSIISMIIALSMLVSLVGCGNSSKKEIENLMTEFEHACNTLDFNSVLNCINPKVSDTVKIGMGIVGLFTDMENDVLFEKLAAALTTEQLGGADFFSSIKIDVKDIVVEDKTATVSTWIKYNISDSQFEREATFNCIYYTEKWYISNFSIN